MIGDRVTLHAGAVIGSGGWLRPLPDGSQIPQVGTVVSGRRRDRCERDGRRATLGATRIGHGTKIDNW